MTLYDLAQKHGTDKGSHGYCPHYEAHLGHLQHDEVFLLEIGVQYGYSLRMWDEYFTHPGALIDGVDIDPPCASLELPERVRVTVSDVKQFEPLEYNVIIDDGSHRSVDIASALRRLWRHLLPGGWYVIEDLQTQRLAHYTQGADLMATFGPLLERLLDDYGAEVMELHAYPKILFLRKRL